MNSALCHSGLRCARTAVQPRSISKSASLLLIRTARDSLRRSMATVKDSIPHIKRTAADQRQSGMFSATIGRIEQVNSTIRLLRLYLDNDQVGCVISMAIKKKMLCFKTSVNPEKKINAIPYSSYTPLKTHIPKNHSLSMCLHTCPDIATYSTCSLRSVIFQASI